MNDFARPRGLGRGLSALLGEPVKTATPANAPAWAAPPAEPARAPIEPPRNVFELPITPPQAPPPPQTSAGEVGPRALAIDLVQRNPSQPRKHFDEV